MYWGRCSADKVHLQVTSRHKTITIAEGDCNVETSWPSNEGPGEPEAPSVPSLFSNSSQLHLPGPLPSKTEGKILRIYELTKV
jgi:hypothetical protein